MVDYESWLHYYICHSAKITHKDLLKRLEEIYEKSNGIIRGNAAYFQIAQKTGIQLLGLYDALDTDNIPLTKDRKNEIIDVLEEILHNKEGLTRTYLKLTRSNSRFQSRLDIIFSEFNRLDVLNGLSIFQDWLNAETV